MDIRKPEWRFVDEAGQTGWYTRVDGTRGYVIDGEIVDRQTWLNYAGEHELGPEWTVEP